MRKYIDLISRPVLLEAQNYEDMFTSTFTLLATPIHAQSLPSIKPQLSPEELITLKAQVKDTIRWAKQTLKRKDRIVWYLRIYRLEITYKRLAPAQAIDVLDAYRKESGETYTPQDGGAYLKSNLEHFLSLPIPEIQDYVFNRQGIETVMHAFADLEYEWKQATSSMIPVSPEDDVIMDFGDGYCWVNLHKAYCPQEASAMGHCGNSPRQHSSDTILSLRQKVEKGGKWFWRPCLTFIMDSTRHLTEMKGRGNDKPAAKYHPYILALIKSDIVAGITGGGYLASHNFSVADLPIEQAQELIAEKPHLATLRMLYDLEGWSTAVEEKVESVLGRGHLAIENSDDETLILDQYYEITTFIEFIPPRYNYNIYHQLEPDQAVSLQNLAHIMEGALRNQSMTETYPLISSLEAFEDALRSGDEQNDVEHDELIELITDNYESVQAFVDRHHARVDEWITSMQTMVEQYAEKYIDHYLENYPFKLSILFTQRDGQEINICCHQRDLVYAIDAMDNAENDDYDDTYTGSELYDCLAAQSWLTIEQDTERGEKKSPDQVLKQIDRAIISSFKRLIKQLTGNSAQLKLPLTYSRPQAKRK